MSIAGRRRVLGGESPELVQHADHLVMSPPDGDLVLDRYRLVRRIGSGGMGVVHLAHDTKLDRAVAVKRIAIDDPAVAKRAAREAKAAARLAHPAIVALYEAAQDDDSVYLVSELVRGRTLAQLMADGELSDRDVLEIGAALCDALAHAHGRGVIHRDVKPQNVIVPDAHRDGGDVAKLTDFGIAMLLGEDVLTRTGDIVGTLAYMAPEQAEGREVTAQADVYALGLVIYEALSGTNPIRARTPASTVRRVGIRLPELGRLRRDLPLELCEAIDRAVSPAPGDRGKVTALRAALKRHGGAVDDEPGTIAGGALEPVSRLAVPRRGRAISVWEDTAVDRAFPAREPDPPVSRLFAGLAAGALAAALVAWVDPVAGGSPVAIAAGTAAVVAALPRLGWLAFLASAIVALGASGHSGLATVIAAAGVPAALLLWRAPAFAFSSPALAPLLGLIAAAGVWPAVAGQARTALERAALGWLGAWWLALAEVMTGRTLLLGPGDAQPRSAWDGSVSGALSHAIAPAFSPAVLAIAAVWALAAAVLPVLVRGRVAAADMIAATAWSAAVATGTQYAAQAVSPGAGPVEVRGLILGAVAAGLAAVALRASRAAA